MTPAQIRRAQASAIRRLAIGKIEWCQSPNVIDRYKRVPETLASILENAREALEGAVTLDNDASILEQRERARA